MKNVPTYYAKTLIIARIAATIIPTPIDFNPLTERERTNTVSVREWHRLMVVEY